MLFFEAIFETKGTVVAASQFVELITSAKPGVWDQRVAMVGWVVHVGGVNVW